MDIYFLYKKNDLEAWAIHNLLQAISRKQEKAPDNSCHTVKLKTLVFSGGWGSRLPPVGFYKSLQENDLSLEFLRNKQVVLVEIFEPWLEERLKTIGCTVTLIDHHLYTDDKGEIIDRSNERSSLEQVISFLRDHLDYEELRSDDGINTLINTGENERTDLDWRLIVANDVGFRPAIAAEAIRQKKDPQKSLIEYREADKKLFTSQEQKNQEDPNKLKEEKENLAKRMRAFTNGLESGSNRFRFRSRQSILDEDHDKILRAWEQGYKKRDWKKLIKTDSSPKTWGVGASQDLHIFYCHHDLSQVATDIVADWLVERELKTITALLEDINIDAKDAAALEKMLRNACLTRYHNLMIIYGDQDSLNSSTIIDSIDLSFAPGQRDVVISLMHLVQQDTYKSFNLVSYAGGSNSCFMGVKLPETHEQDSGNPIPGIVEEILDSLLVYNRPLESMRTGFFLPIKIKTELKNDPKIPSFNLQNVDEIVPNQEEKNYFLSYLRDEKLFPAPIDATSHPFKISNGQRCFDLPELTEPLYLRVEGFLPDKNPGWKLEAELKQIRIHTYWQNIVILEWSLDENDPLLYKNPDDYEDEDRQDRYWVTLIQDTGEHQPWTLGDHLSLNANARFVYAPFDQGKWFSCVDITLFEKSRDAEQIMKAKLHYGRKNPANTTYLQHLLRELYKNCIVNKHMQTIEINDDSVVFDERALILSSALAVGYQPRVSSSQRYHEVCLARYADVEVPGRDYSYETEFSKKLLSNQRYPRFESSGSFYLATNHSFVFLGYGDFARGFIHCKHMKGAYKRLFLLMQQYRANLHVYQARLSRAEGNDNPAAVHELHEDYLDFTTNWWFETVTSQDQGNELNQLLWKQAGFKNSFSEIDEKIRHQDDFRTRKSEERKARLREVLSNFGLPFTLLVVLYTMAQNSENPVLLVIRRLKDFLLSLKTDNVQIFNEYKVSWLVFLILFLNAFLLTSGLLYLFQLKKAERISAKRAFFKHSGIVSKVKSWLWKRRYGIAWITLWLVMTLLMVL